MQLVYILQKAPGLEIHRADNTVMTLQKNTNDNVGLHASLSHRLVGSLPQALSIRFPRLNGARCWMSPIGKLHCAAKHTPCMNNLVLVSI